MRSEKDLTIKKGKVSVEYIEVDGKIINLTPVHAQNIELYITHKDCEQCGTEFEKSYTYDRFCSSCAHEKFKKRYFGLELVEWDEKTPLCLFEDDTYFFDRDEIEEYCEEHEVEISGLMLVLCEESSFVPLDLECLTSSGGVVHEDWEPSEQLEQKIKEFNDFLEKEGTDTWFPTNKRVKLKY